MRTWIIVLAACLIVLPAAGCSKKESTATPGAVSGSAAPSPGATATSGASPGASASPGATAPAQGEKLPTISRAAVDKLGPDSKVSDLEKAAGKPGKLIKEENGKKTYELQLSGESNYYVDITYASDGSILEKNIFQK